MRSSRVVPSRVVFWQPIPSMHQLPFIESFAERFDGDVACVCGEAVTPDRIALGWANPSETRVPLSTPTLAASLAEISEAGPETLHVFSGIHCHPYVNACFRKAVVSRSPIALITESYDPRGIRGLIRRLRSRVDAIRFRRAVRLIFAMGETGAAWFRSAGFPADRVHPFAYVTPVPPSLDAKVGLHPLCRLLYVGQLIPRKGVDILLRALAALHSSSWTLTIVGSGSAEADLRDLAVREGVSEAVSWKGVLPNPLVAQAMVDHDVLVLPSRYDGWGAVVNEALTVGTPVICSDACGAADLIRSPEMGRVARGGSVSSLAAALRLQIVAVRSSPAVRRHLAGAAAQRFSPTAVADYFHTALRASFNASCKPCPPWRGPA